MFFSYFIHTFVANNEIDKMSLYLYSTNTMLSHRIAKEFYKGRFYVWCAPVFEASKNPMSIYSKIPRSSSPYEIYMEYKKDVETGDLHSAKIEANRNGLKRGALEALKKGWIDDVEMETINQIIDKADITMFKPILYIIERSMVEKELIKVPVSDKANPLSVEYKIEELTEDKFEVIYQF